MGQTITIHGKDGDFAAYLATPAADTAGAAQPGVVVIQEIFGVNAVMRSIADQLAADGFRALVPDLFWRLEPGVDITDQTEAEWQHALDLMNRFDADAGVTDIQASIDHLRAAQGGSRKVGAVGYCLGGLVAYLTAARTNIDASVGYYGVSIQTRLNEAKAIKKPLMLHIAAEDRFTPKTEQAKILDGLKDNPLITCHVYAGVDHAFARPGPKTFNKTTAKLAEDRTLSFLRRHLA
jgi:carboxymethylenebutenolidase